MKYLGLKLTDYIQYLYEQNYKTLMKKNLKKEKELNKWRQPMSKNRKTQYCQDVYSSQLVYTFNAISSNLSTSYCVDIGKLTFKFAWRGKIPRITNTILKKKNKVGGLDYPTSRNTIKLRVNNTVVLVKE